MIKNHHYMFKDLEFWPENGLIYMLDYRDSINDDDRFKVLTRAEMASRAIALRQELDLMKYADERKELSDAIVNMCKVVKIAKAQGDPTDPEAARQLAYTNKKAIFVNNFNPLHKTGGKIITSTHNYTPYVPPMPQGKRLASADSAPDKLIHIN